MTSFQGDQNRVRIAYLHLIEFCTAWFHRVTVGAWFLRVPIENSKSIILWLTSIWAVLAETKSMQNQAYQFDGDLFVILDVSSVVDVTKRTASEFAAQSVFSSDP